MFPEIITQGEALKKGTAALIAAGIESPYLDASLFLADILGVDRSHLILQDRDPLGDSEAALFEERLARRIQGEPTAYILGHREFWNLDFLVTPDVLIPRPDTEILVEKALAYLAKIGKPSPLVLELCTGSGAAAIAIKKTFPTCEIYASDISPRALEIARRNLERIFPEQLDAIFFFEGDLFSGIPAAALPKRYNLIIANPPYVSEGLIETLSPEVRREPTLALNGGEDGMDLIRRIIYESPRYLLPGGALFLEAGPEQAPLIKSLLAANGFVDIETCLDLAGRERVTGGALQK